MPTSPSLFGIRLDPSRYETHPFPDMALWVSLSPRQMELADAEGERVFRYWKERRSVQVYDRGKSDAERRDSMSVRNNHENLIESARAEVAFAYVIDGEWNAGAQKRIGATDVIGPPPGMAKFEVRSSKNHARPMEIRDGDFGRALDQTVTFVTGSAGRYALRGYMGVREARDHPRHAYWLKWTPYPRCLWIPQDDLHRWKPGAAEYRKAWSHG